MKGGFKSSKPTAPGSARLFADAHLATPPSSVHVANIDGASRGNPGPASYAVVLRDPSGKIVLELAKNIGRETNNVAEYYALLAALDYATSHDIRGLRIRSDSELLVRQMQGRYKVKSPDLKPLHERAANIALDQASGRRTVKSETAKPLQSSLGDSQFTAAKGSAKLPQTSSNSVRASLKVRARFQNGVLVPTEPLDLPEGSEVTLDVCK